MFISPANFMAPMSIGRPGMTGFAPSPGMLPAVPLGNSPAGLNAFGGFNANCCQNPNDAMFALLGMTMMLIMMMIQLMLQTLHQQASGSSNPGGPTFGSPSSGGSFSGLPGGPSGPGAPASPGGSFPATSGTPTSASGVGQTSAMQRLADAGIRAANARNSRGWCLAGVQDALAAAGLGMTRLGSAYQKADQLARDSRFREIRVPADQLDNLPAGCIIVWNRSGNGSAFGQHGHIQITQGGGRATSDHMESVRNLGTSYRVFVPV